MDILTTGIFILVAANLIASVAVVRVSVFTPRQRAFQLVLIWLVPVLGAVVCLAFISSQSLGNKAENNFDPLYFPGDGGFPGGSVHGNFSDSNGDASGSGDSGGGD